MAKSKQEFPEELFITREGEKDDDEYLIASESVEQIDFRDRCEAREVAVYKLEKVVQVEQTRTIK